MLKQRFITSLAIFIAGFALSAAVGGRSLAFLSNSPESAAAQRTSTELEYRVVTQRSNDRGISLEEQLNRVGANGFEVCGISQNAMGADNGYNVVTVVARRPKR